MFGTMKQLFEYLRGCLESWSWSRSTVELALSRHGNGMCHEVVGFAEGEEDDDDGAEVGTGYGDEEGFGGDGVDEIGLWIADGTDTSSTNSKSVSDQNLNDDTECPWSAFDPQWPASSIEASPTSLSCTSAWARSSTHMDSDDDTLAEFDTTNLHSGSSVTRIAALISPLPNTSLAHLLAPPFINSFSPFARAELRTVAAEWPFNSPSYDRTDIGRDRLDSIETSSTISSLESDEHQQSFELLSTPTSPNHQESVTNFNAAETMRSRLDALDAQRSQLEGLIEMRLEHDVAMCNTLEQAENRRKSLEESVLTTIQQRGANIKAMYGLERRLRAIAREEQILRGLTRPAYQRIGLLNDLIRTKQFVRDICQRMWLPRFGSYIAVAVSMSVAALLNLIGVVVSWNANAGLKMLVLLITYLLCWPLCVGCCFELVGEGQESN